MASDNPYETDVFPDSASPPAPAPPISTSNVNPYEDVPPLAVATGKSDPYSAWHTAGRVATDAAFGIPDAITSLNRGLHWGFNSGLDYLTGATPPANGPAVAAGSSVPYLAPIARKAIGVEELPADAGMGSILGEGLGSAVAGGLGSSASRAVVRGIKAAPEAIANVNPFRPIKKVTEDVLSKQSDDWYKALDNLDVRYSQKTPEHMADAIELYQYKPKGINQVNAPQAINDVGLLRNIDPASNVAPGAVRDYVGPRDIEAVRQNLSQTRALPRNPSAPREAQAANIAIKGIDNFLANPPASAIHPSNITDPTLVDAVLGQARGNHAAAERIGYLTGTREDIGTRFAAKPGASSSQEAQALRDRSAAALIASREGRGPLYGYSPAEKQLLEKVAQVSLLGKIGANAPQSLEGLVLRSGGYGFGSSMLGLSPKTSSIIAGTIPAIQYGAKKLSDFGTQRAYQRAVEMMAARSPYAQSLGIRAPQTARTIGAPLVSRDDIAAALMSPNYQNILPEEQ